MTGENYIKRLRDDRFLSPEDMCLSDLIEIAKMVMDGDLRHVNDEDFRKEMAEAYDASV